jgi:hypothetical protein
MFDINLGMMFQLLKRVIATKTTLQKQVFPCGIQFKKIIDAAK